MKWASRVKALVAKPDDLSSTTGIYKMKERKTPEDVLCCLHT